MGSSTFGTGLQDAVDGTEGIQRSLGRFPSIDQSGIDHVDADGAGSVDAHEGEDKHPMNVVRHQLAAETIRGDEAAVMGDLVLGKESAVGGGRRCAAAGVGSFWGRYVEGGEPVQIVDRVVIPQFHFSLDHASP